MTRPGLVSAMMQHSAVAHDICVCSTQPYLAGSARWMALWISKAVVSTGPSPERMVPSASISTRLCGLTSSHSMPYRTTKNFSGLPGTSAVRWLHTPSLRPNLWQSRYTAARSDRIEASSDLTDAIMSPRSIARRLQTRGGGSAAPCWRGCGVGLGFVVCVCGLGEVLWCVVVRLKRRVALQAKPPHPARPLAGAARGVALVVWRGAQLAEVRIHLHGLA